MLGFSKPYYPFDLHRPEDPPGILYGASPAPHFGSLSFRRHSRRFRLDADARLQRVENIKPCINLCK
jgi:hypothetical protein